MKHMLSFDGVTIKPTELCAFQLFRNFGVLQHVC